MFSVSFSKHKIHERLMTPGAGLERDGASEEDEKKESRSADCWCFALLGSGRRTLIL